MIKAKKKKKLILVKVNNNKGLLLLICLDFVKTFFFLYAAGFLERKKKFVPVRTEFEMECKVGCSVAAITRKKSQSK